MSIVLVVYCALLNLAKLQIDSKHFSLKYLIISIYFQRKMDQVKVNGPKWWKGWTVIWMKVGGPIGGKPIPTDLTKSQSKFVALFPDFYLKSLLSCYLKIVHFCFTRPSSFALLVHFHSITFNLTSNFSLKDRPVSSTFESINDHSLPRTVHFKPF